MQNLLYEIAADRVAAEEIEGEVVIINVATGNYYNTEGVGGWAWGCCVAGQSVEEMTSAGCSLYAVSGETLQADLTSFFQSLKDEDLVSVREVPATAKGTLGTGTGGQQAYQAPKLTAYRDLRDLLALDPPMPRQFSRAGKDTSAGVTKIS